MAAVYGIVCGPRLTKRLPQELQRIGAGTVTFTDESVFGDLDDLKKVLLREASRVIDSWKRILLIDEGFVNGGNVQAQVEEFIAVQDLMVTQGLTNVRLELITRNSDLYYEIQRGYKGFPGIIYNNTEVHLFHGKLVLREVLAVLQGAYEGRGYFIEEKKPLSRVERYEKTRKELQEDYSTVNKEVLEFEKDVPSSKLSRQDYSDSEESLRKQEEYWIRQSQQDDDSNQTETNDDTPTQTEPVINVNKEQSINNASRNSQTVSTEVRVNNRQVNTNNLQGIDELHYLYNRLAQDAATITDSKLMTDKGSTIVVTGAPGSGVSGFVAQAAEIYALIGLKVLVIDLDGNKRMQTVYFSNFDDKINEGYGLSNGLFNVANGGIVSKASVPVTSRISVCGLSRTFNQVDDDSIKSFSYVMKEVCQDALNTQGFDIVLIDIPFKHMKDYVTQFGSVSRMIVLTDNTYYNLEHFLGVDLVSLVDANTLMLRDLLKKTSIVLNKVKPNLRDADGYRVDKDYVKKLLMKVGTPYDDMFVVGEIPYYDDWENQFLTNKRYVWTNDVLLGLVKNILREAV